MKRSLLRFFIRLGLIHGTRFQRQLRRLVTPQPDDKFFNRWALELF